MIFRYALLGVVAILVATAGVYGLMRWRDPFDDRGFAPDAWNNAVSDKFRASMARDLVNHHLHQGMSKEDVIDLLGRPIGKVHPARIDGRVLGAVHESIEYPIGNWSWYGFDDAFVYVHFDSSQKVIAAEIYGY